MGEVTSGEGMEGEADLGGCESSRTGEVTSLIHNQQQQQQQQHYSDNPTLHPPSSGTPGHLSPRMLDLTLPFSRSSASNLSDLVVSSAPRIGEVMEPSGSSGGTYLHTSKVRTSMPSNINGASSLPRNVTMPKSRPVGVAVQPGDATLPRAHGNRRRGGGTGFFGWQAVPECLQCRGDPVNPTSKRSVRNGRNVYEEPNPAVSSASPHARAQHSPDMYLFRQGSTRSVTSKSDCAGMASRGRRLGYASHSRASLRSQVSFEGFRDCHECHNHNINGHRRVMSPESHCLPRVFGSTASALSDNREKSSGGGHERIKCSTPMDTGRNYLTLDCTKPQRSGGSSSCMQLRQSFASGGYQRRSMEVLSSDPSMHSQQSLTPSRRHYPALGVSPVKYPSLGRPLKEEPQGKLDRIVGRSLSLETRERGLVVPRLETPESEENQDFRQMSEQSAHIGSARSLAYRQDSQSSASPPFLSIIPDIHHR
ncbi:hypothetical protein Pmani_034708 [Petrolisthes manimaculis]|uniref:Uncharacterized protein n=1 Tax=Petrolisthes manimaculis TaxID=1843537 RepID=A0AAE1NLY7_9EUCA|nr:hypothetical protein Pmani_034708 [Petrolisthes manimaculis]